MSRYSDLVIADGGANLLGYWPLDAEFGVTDKSTGGHNATAAGSPTVGGLVGPGELTATALNGSSQRFTTAYNPFSTGVTRTYEGWANRTDTLAAHTLVAGDDATVTNVPTIQLEASSETFALYPKIGSTNITWAAAWPGTAQWVHWMLVHIGGTSAALYINGALVSSQAIATNYGGTPGNLSIASRQTGSTWWKGGQAHVAVYNADQSALANVHYNAGIWALTRPTGPAPWY